MVYFVRFRSVYIFKKYEKTKICLFLSVKLMALLKSAQRFSIYHFGKGIKISWLIVPCFLNVWIELPFLKVLLDFSSYFFGMIKKNMQTNLSIFLNVWNWWIALKVPKYYQATFFDVRKNMWTDFSMVFEDLKLMNPLESA